MGTTNITKIQREVLEAAARRNDYAAWPIREGKLNIGSATRIMKELVRRGLVVEKPAGAKAPIWREDDDGRPLMAVISDDGLVAIGMLPAGKTDRRPRTAGKTGAVGANKATVARVSDNVPRAPRAGTKLAILVALLGRNEGATIDEMSAATGWQSHSVRGVLSAVVKRKLGLKIVSEKLEARGRVYRTRDGSAMALVQRN